MGPFTLAILKVGPAPAPPWSEVSRAPGFIDKQEYGKNESGDSYVLTCWDHAETFRNWYGTMPESAQRESVAKLLVLEDLIRPAGSFGPELNAVMEEYLRRSTILSVILANADGTIAEVTPGFAARMKTTVPELRGRAISSLLVETDAALLRDILGSDGNRGPREFLLNFVDSQGLKFTSNCFFAFLGDRFVLIVESVSGEDRAVEERIIELSNRMTVTVRDYAHQNRILARALQWMASNLSGIYKSVASLSASVTPVIVCVKCERVKIGDEWLELPGLHKAAEGLSHGYCPECFEIVRNSFEGETD